MNTLNTWKQLTNQITEDWIRKYFEIEDTEEVYFDWICNDIGEIFEFADYFIHFSSVVKCIELNITPEQFFDWYHYCLENQSVNISLANFILPPKKDEKSLQDSKNNLIFAQETFKKALEDVR